MFDLVPVLHHQKKQLFLLLFLFWGGVMSASAQSLIEKFQLADAYLRSNQTDKAIPLLEDIYDAQPKEFAYYDKLREAYMAAKRWMDAERIVDARLQTERTPQLLSDKAAILFKQGRDPEALQTWQDAIQLAPDDQNTWRIVYYSLYRERLFEQASVFLEQAREKLHSPKLFNIELAYTYGFAGKFDKAIQEYITLLAENPSMIAFAKAQLAQLDEQEGALAAFTAGMDRAIRQDPINKAYRELAAWLYLEAGDYQKALNANIAIDRLEGQNGVTIFMFGQTAANAGYFEVAEQAYKTILEQYGTSPTAPSAQLALADMHRKRAESLREMAVSPSGTTVSAPHYEAARTAYEQFLQAYPNHYLLAQVYFELASLYQEVFLNLADAERTYQTIEGRFGGTDYYWKAQYALGEIALARNDLALAKQYFTKINATLRTGELAEDARYELAMLDFYQGHFETAKAMAEAINENTTTDVTNDAIELKVIIRENTENDSVFVAMNLFAKAKLLERQHHYQSAWAKLDSLIHAFPQHTIVDEAQYAQAGVLRALGRYAEAILAYQTVQKTYATTYLADRALFQIAEIQDQNLQDKTAAIEAYTDLLLKYPGSLLIPEARSRIRKLRGDKLSS